MDSVLIKQQRIKQNGIHYTPAVLADFLARQIKPYLAAGSLRVLDPACGDGQLLESMLSQLKNRKAAVHGFDTDVLAIDAARGRLRSRKLDEFNLRCEDFLDHFHELPRVDCVISNPPYVRTQSLGSVRSQRLAEQFQLTGRVDLYQAFTSAIAKVLKPGSVMGLLTSNRFLSVKAGRAMRQLLEREFDLRAIIDLGETRLFHAAVLPAIVIATKKKDTRQDVDADCKFIRVGQDFAPKRQMPTSTDKQLLNHIARQKPGPVKTSSGYFDVQYGKLNSTGDSQQQWRLDTPRTANWLRKISQAQKTTFGQVAQIKVGIKTTADPVFIAPSGSGVLPDSGLVRPLLTHHDAKRWRTSGTSDFETARQVLYPYEMTSSRPVPIALSKFSSARNYLAKHRQRLTSRKYLIDAGRKWFEIWVPQQPDRWAHPKIVWPDISEGPRFFLDNSGAVVNGDCYWLQLRDGLDPNWLFLILAVANSSIAIQFYDAMFHNKLYAGRRRYMTQYVNQFPLPDLNSSNSKLIIKYVKKMMKRKTITKRMEAELESLVLRAFGLD